MKFDLFWRYELKVGEIEITDPNILDILELSLEIEPLCLVPRLLIKYDGDLKKEIERKIVDLSIIPLSYHRNKDKEL